MQHVAADSDGETRNAALGAADRQRVQQGLSRMLMGAVAGVDDVAIDFLRQQFDGAGRVMANDENIRPHGVQRHRRVDQRFAFRDGRGRDVHVHDVGPETLASQLERALRPRRGFEEQVDERAPLQDVALFSDLPVLIGGFVGQIQQCGDFACLQPLAGQQMAARECRDFSG